MGRRHARTNWEKIAEQLIEIAAAAVEVMKRFGLL